MSDYLGTIELTETTVFRWVPQYRYDYTVNPDGTVTINGLETQGYEIYGDLQLVNEAATFARSQQVAEFFKGSQRTWYDDGVEKLWKATFCRTDSHGNFYAWINEPFITDHVGDNESEIKMYLRLIGDTTGFKSYYILTDLDRESSDWGI